MYKQFKEDKTILVELLSAVALFALAMMLTKVNLTQKFDIHVYFWVISLTIISMVQFISVKINMVVVRLVMAWISGIVWTWFAFTSLNVLTYFPALVIGSLNIYACLLLSNRVHFDWLELTRE